ncbi:hypothetical protein DVK85_10030 [Flavobacterium arcticum]|uniref:Lipoprotein n=2 Tax=Flavobacterium arcticum TaxID=1784713 RepID=A0A345HD93_9FLAO|nr:hypothetical protein DVK85_10030 [Flavobacterium arcticum]
MRIVSKLVIILFLALTSCGNKETKQQKYPIYDNWYSSFSEFESDSIYYKIDVKGNYNEELFLMTKKIIVKDSLFGAYTYENWQKSWNYSKKVDSEPLFIYTIAMYDGKSFNDFSKLVFNPSWIKYPVLKKGEFTNLDTVSKSDMQHETPVYLKIMAASNDNLNCTSINLIYNNNKWKMFSREVLDYSNYGRSLNGYCMDTILGEYSKIDTIRFDRVFDDHYFDCK